MINLFVGTSGWTYDHWRGTFYPDDLAKASWFSYYADQFNSVEINATFYRKFKDQTYTNWRNKAPEGFRYVLKAPRLITHRKYLQDVADDIKAFDHSARILKDKLGLILLQLAPGTPYDLQRLRTAITAFDDPHKIAVEFRHKQWITQDTVLLLRELGATYCNPDSPRCDLTELVTSHVGYLRLHGRKHWYAHDYSMQELCEIANTIERMAACGLEDIYIFFNNDFEGFAPKNALMLKYIIEDTSRSGDYQKYMPS